MRRLLLIAVVAACGGTSKPAPTAPLPGDPKEASAAPAPPVESKPAPEPVEPKPAPPAGPVKVKIPAAQTTVKIVSGGKGKKETVRYSAKAGSKQAIELAMDFAGKQDTEEQIVPTIVLTGEAETKAVDKDGNAEYTVTVTGTDARSVAGSQVPVDKFKAVIGSLAGLTIGGTLG